MKKNVFYYISQKVVNTKLTQICQNFSQYCNVSILLMKVSRTAGYEMLNKSNDSKRKIKQNILKCSEKRKKKTRAKQRSGREIPS